MSLCNILYYIDHRRMMHSVVGEGAEDLGKLKIEANIY